MGISKKKLKKPGKRGMFRIKVKLTKKKLKLWTKGPQCKK